MYKLVSINNHLSKNLISRFNQQETLALNTFNTIINKRLSEFNGSSETTRVISFNQWLAGLMDSAGCFYISKTKNLSCEITVSLREVQALYKIKTKFRGSISLRQGSNSYRWRLHKKEDLIYFLNSINGYIYVKINKFQIALFLFNIPFKEIKLSFDNAWFSGFFEVSGYIYIDKFNNYQISIYVGHKDKTILNIIHKIFDGNIYYDNSCDGYTWTVSSLKNLLNLFEYFTLFPLQSNKNSDLVSAKRFFRYRLLKYHLDPLQASRLNHFVDIFQKRKKI